MRRPALSVGGGAAAPVAMVSRRDLLQVAALAVVSRACVCVLAVLSTVVVPLHDPGEDVKVFPVRRTHLLAPFARWDAAHFLSIASDNGGDGGGGGAGETGAVDERAHAFFPLLPTMLRSVATHVLRPLQPLLLLLLPGGGVAAGKGGEEGDVLVLAGVVCNAALFVVASVMLFALSMAVFRDKSFAWRSVLVFAMNPASIFFSTVYSESLFAACTWFAILLLEGQRPWSAMVPAMLAATARSNGMLTAGLFLLFAVRRARLQSKRVSPLFRVNIMLQTALQCCLLLVPYGAIQHHAFLHTCVDSRGAALVDRPEWCEDPMPSVYAYVQRKYWNVGLLRYYEFKQIPNFLLAAPAAALTCTVVWAFWLFNKHALSQGLVPALRHLLVPPRTLSSSPPDPATAPTAPTPSSPKAATITQGRHKLTRAAASTAAARQSNRAALAPVVLGSMSWGAQTFPYVAHMAVLAVVCVLTANVQILTRLLAAACPAFHWILADLLWAPRTRSSFGRVRRLLLVVYVLGYATLGTVLHANFYPWT